MKELLELVSDRWWLAILIVPLVFGFAPGFILRLIVLMYPKGDPRRKELVAELYVMSHPMRLLWTAQQLETALFEGAFPRIWNGFNNWLFKPRLRSGVRRNKRYPYTFAIPSKAEKAEIRPGGHVKVMYEMKDVGGERLWVSVEKVGRIWLTGHIDNEPLLPSLDYGDRIRFRRAHIIDIL